MQKRLTTVALITAFAVPTITHAGGPVITPEETEVSPAHDRKVPGWVLPVLGLAVIAIIASNGGGDTCNTPDPVPTPDDGGC